MAKIAKDSEREELATLEIIELAINDLDTLTRAFNLIQEVCNEANPSYQELPQIKENLIN